MIFNTPKFLNSTLAAGSILLAFSASNCYAADYGPTWFKPYVGIESRASSTHHENNNVVNLSLIVKALPETYTGGGVFFGNQFNKYFALEAGYDINRGRTKNSTITGGKFEVDDTFGAGGTIPIDISFAEFNLKSSRDGWHIDVIGLMPLTEDLSFIISPGLARISLKITGDAAWEAASSDPPAPPVPTQGIIDIADHVTNQQKTIFRIGGGLQYITSKFGIRSMLRLENTGRFTQNGHKLLRDSYSFNLALFFTI